MIYIVISYVIGTFMTAWFVGKLYGQDLRGHHSGNLGARNAGRTFGKWAFAVTAFVDVTKGMGVVLLGHYLAVGDAAVAAGALAVVCGHLYPFWLKGRGGKGVATILGVLLLFSQQAMLLLAVGFLIAFSMSRSATLSLMIGFLCYSVGIIIWQLEGFVFLLIAILLVMWKHRDNILERVK